MRNNIKTMLLTLAMALVAVVGAKAQDKSLEIVSFNILQTDMDARIQAPVEDQNGEKCALIKVVSSIKGLKFESPAMGIVKQEKVDGEIWVYVPKDSRYVTIHHEDYPTFRNYAYPVKIESASVYEMIIKGHNGIDPTGNAQMVTMNVQPTSASLYVDDEEVPVENGLYTSMMPKGFHTYRVEAKDYESVSGSFELADQQWVRNIRLKEKFGYVSVTTYPEAGADVYVGDELVGQTPFKSGILYPQSYKVRVTKPLYFPKDTMVTVNAGGETTDVTLNMVSTIKPKEGRKTFIMADVALGGLQPTYGVMVGMAATSGGYLHAKSDFGSVDASWECDNTGMLTSGGTGKPYYTGDKAKSSFSITAGYVHRLTLNNPLKHGGMGGLYAFAGVGYGYRTLAWKTEPNGISETSQWVTNTDDSAKGVAAEAGLIGRFGGFALMLNYHTVSFKSHEVGLGIGLFF